MKEVGEHSHVIIEGLGGKRLSCNVRNIRIWIEREEAVGVYKEAIEDFMREAF